ncbi:hypothetical protein [Micrococcus sp. TA1]|uniref:hypothetical protein n=1 Tax=Micrococcus sp. TA1 TaxID=681627 RepID=UPI0016103D59|nr:hypothetical protein [Micrococcus sp. TA1]MBB5749580.1 hypothetical protein [Micrococcus sp. TA1]
MGVVLYCHFLLIVYRDHIVPIYDYFNFHWVGYSPESQFIATMATIVMASCLPLKVEGFGTFAKWILLFTVFVPSQIIPIASGYVAEHQNLWLSALVLAAFLALHVLHVFLSRGPDWHIPRLDRSVYVAGLVVAWVLVYLIFFAVAGWSGLRNPFENVYDARSEFSENVMSRNVFLAYAVPLAVKVINPMLVVVGIQRRAWILVVMGFVGSLAVFSANSQKSVFVTMLLVPLIYGLARWRHRFSGPFLSLAFVGLALVSLVSDVLMEFVFRRIVVTPGLLVGMYIDNYQERGYAFLQHSFLEPWFDVVRPPPAREIGFNYWASESMAANANFLGDGFANFGVVGMVVFAGILGLVLGLTDRLTRSVELPVVAAGSVGVIFAVIDTALFTSLLTHGFIVMVFLLAVYPLRQQEGETEAKPSLPLEESESVVRRR